MALLQIGSAGNVMNQASNALGSNAITNALGVDSGSIPTPSKFLTKFSPSTVFTYRSLAYELRTINNFDIIFHWFPRYSQIRSMFAQAFSAADTTELNMLVDSITLPNILTRVESGNSETPFNLSAPKNISNSDSLSIRFFNTEFPFVSQCFYQWINETLSPYWVYGATLSKDSTSMSNLKSIGSKMYYENEDKNPLPLENVRKWFGYDDMHKMVYIMSETESSPFTRADIEIKYYSGSMKELHSVWFMGAFPTRITLPPVNNQSGLSTSDVTFSYDSICVNSPFRFNGDGGVNTTGMVSSALGGLSNSSEWTAGMYEDTLTQIANTHLAKLSRRMNKITSRAGDKLSGALNNAQKKVTA